MPATFNETKSLEPEPVIVTVIGIASGNDNGNGLGLGFYSQGPFRGPGFPITMNAETWRFRAGPEGPAYDRIA